MGATQTKLWQAVWVRHHGAQLGSNKWRHEFFCQSCQDGLRRTMWVLQKGWHLLKGNYYWITELLEDTINRCFYFVISSYMFRPFYLAIFMLAWRLCVLSYLHYYNISIPILQLQLLWETSHCVLCVYLVMVALQVFGAGCCPSFIATDGNYQHFNI
jgi:hypothetical protein